MDASRDDSVAESARPLPPEWLFWAGIAVVVAAQTQFAWALDPKHGPFIAICDVLTGLAVATWILWRFRTGSKNLAWPPAAVFGLVLTAIISAGMAESVRQSAVEIVQMLLYFALAYMFFTDVFTTRRRLVYALVAAGMAVAANILIAAVQYFTVSDAHDVGALLTNRNVYSGMLTVVLPVAFGVMLWHDRRWAQWVLGGGIALGVLTMLSPPLVWVALIAMVPLVVYRHDQMARTGAIFLLVVALAVAILPNNRAAVVNELLNPEETGPIYKIAGEEENRFIVKKRWLEWKPALNMMAENFMFGVGAGNFQLNIGKSQYYGFLPNVKKTEADTNNLYLVVGCTLGFPGLVCLIAYIGKFWRDSRALWLRVDEGWTRGLSMGLAAAVGALAFSNIFTSLFVRGVGLIWALLFAIITILATGTFGRSER